MMRDVHFALSKLECLTCDALCILSGEMDREAAAKAAEQPAEE